VPICLPCFAAANNLEQLWLVVEVRQKDEAEAAVRLDKLELQQVLRMLFVFHHRDYQAVLLQSYHFTGVLRDVEAAGTFALQSPLLQLGCVEDCHPGVLILCEHCEV